MLVTEWHLTPHNFSEHADCNVGAELSRAVIANVWDWEVPIDECEGEKKEGYRHKGESYSRGEKAVLGMFRGITWFGCQLEQIEYDKKCRQNLQSPFDGNEQPTRKKNIG